jgi:hypothetical protein
LWHVERWPYLTYILCGCQHYQMGPLCPEESVGCLVGARQGGTVPRVVYSTDSRR